MDIRNICEIVIVSKSANVNTGYMSKEPALLLNGFTFTPNIATCGSFSFSLANLGGGAYDSSIFTFDSSIPSISVYSTNIAQLGIYNLELTATLAPWKTEVIQITIAIT